MPPRDELLRKERNHGEPRGPWLKPAAGQPLPIETAFKVLHACSTKWDAPRGVKPTSVVVHCTAATNPAESTANYFHSCENDSGSTQAVADDYVGYECIPDDAVCAGAPPLNGEGLHIEQPGLVTWSRETWLARDRQLRRVAWWTAQKCMKYDIPVRLLHAADLRKMGEGAKGITYHWAVSEAFHQSTHNDPGPNFPWDVFMNYVREYAGEGDDDMAFKDYKDGYRAAKDGEELPKDATDDFAFGYRHRKLHDEEPPETGSKPHTHKSEPHTHKPEDVQHEHVYGGKVGPARGSGG